MITNPNPHEKTHNLKNNEKEIRHTKALANANYDLKEEFSLFAPLPLPSSNFFPVLFYAPLYLMCEFENFSHILAQFIQKCFFKLFFQHLLNDSPLGGVGFRLKRGFC